VIELIGAPSDRRFDQNVMALSYRQGGRADHGPR